MTLHTPAHQLGIHRECTCKIRGSRWIFYMSSPRKEWTCRMIMPSLQDALQRPATFTWMGIHDSICEFPVPLDGSVEHITECEQSQSLITHIRTAMGLTKGLLQYSFVPQCFPWSFVRLLSDDPAIVRDCLEDARTTWALVLKLEQSNLPLHQQFSKAAGEHWKRTPS